MTEKKQPEPQKLTDEEKQKLESHFKKDSLNAKEELKKTEELKANPDEKFFQKDNPGFSPGYMHDHDSKVQKSDTVGSVEPRIQSEPDESVGNPVRISTRNQPVMPEPLVGSELPNPQILPQTKQDLMATIEFILKVTSADSQQLEIALARISSQIPVNYTPRLFMESSEPNPGGLRRA